jgi:hypothetical protein
MSEKDEPKTEAQKLWEQKESFYSAVGQAISMWSSMESKLVEVAAILLGTTDHKTGLFLYSIMNFHAWLNIIDELFALEPQYSSHKSAWLDISSELRTHNDTRTRLAHHTVWDSADPTIALRPSQYDVRSKSKKHQPLVERQIVDFTSTILAIDKKLSALVAGMLATRNALRSTLPGIHAR